MYVDAGDWKEFLDFQKSSEGKNYNCEYIANEVHLRGRHPGLITRVGTYEQRWNWIAISEMIEDCRIRWKDFFDDEQFKTEIMGTDLTEQDMQYGIGE